MANTYLTRTFGTATSRTKFTVSVWLKKCTINASIPDEKHFFNGYNSSNDRFMIYMTNTDQLRIRNVDNAIENVIYTSNAKYRDVNGWYHVVVRIDSSQAGGNRIRAYVNGEQITSWSSSTEPNQNADFALGNNAFSNIIGSYAGLSHFWDGGMSHYHYCDGQSYAPTEFGQYDANGVWTIKTSPSVTYGNQGFFLFKDDNSLTDQSGNTNNFTVGGGTLTKTEDSPSNVFATLNSLDVSAGTPAGLINGNNTYNKTATGIGTNGARVATIAPSSGKWYWEFKPADTVSVILGFARTDHLNNTGGLDGFIGEDVGTFGIKADGSKIIAGTSTPDSYSFTANDVIGFAMDLDNNKFYAHKNGTYYNSGDPTSGATGTGAIGNITAGNNYAPLVQNNSYTTANVVHCNFGNGYFGTTAVASAGTNASGNGIFEFDVPTGFTALSTKGLNL